MKALIETTFPILAIIAIPIMFYAGIILGSEISRSNKSNLDIVNEEVFEFAEEAYIDDIPFDTEKIVEYVKLDQSLNVEYTTVAEKTTKDIPIKRSKVANQLIENTLVNNSIY